MNRLKKRRKELRLTQKQIAELLKISSQAYGLYESGKRRLPIEFIKPIAEMLKVPVDFIVSEFCDLYVKYQS